MGVLRAADTIICCQHGYLEPVRKGHFVATFNGPNGSSNDADNYLLRSVGGLNQGITPGTWGMVNYPISFPKELGTAELSLKYVMLTDGSRKSTLQFWEKWKQKTYDHDKDLPALFNKCTGSGQIQVMLPDGSNYLTYEISYCWPKNVSIGDMDRDSSDPLDFTVSLVAGKIKLQD